MVNKVYLGRSLIAKKYASDISPFCITIKKELWSKYISMYILVNMLDLKCSPRGLQDPGLVGLLPVGPVHLALQEHAHPRDCAPVHVGHAVK